MFGIINPSKKVWDRAILGLKNAIIVKHNVNCQRRIVRNDNALSGSKVGYIRPSVSSSSKFRDPSFFSGEAVPSFALSKCLRAQPSNDKSGPFLIFAVERIQRDKTDKSTPEIDPPFFPQSRAQPTFQRMPICKKWTIVCYETDIFIAHSQLCSWKSGYTWIHQIDSEQTALIVRVQTLVFGCSSRSTSWPSAIFTSFCRWC